MKISVVITTHRRAILLSRALLSVLAQAGNPQIVLVSDAPCADTDRLAAVLLRDTDLYIQRHGAPGPATSRNVGLRAAQGDFLVFLDDDDALTPGFFSAIEPYLDPGRVLYTDFINAQEVLVDDAPVAIGSETRSLAATRLEEIYVKNFIPLPCLIYPAAALRNRWTDETLVLNEDWDFILNVMTAMPLRHVPVQGAVIYTRHAPDNRGRRNDHLLPDTYRRIYKRWPAPTPELKEARQRFFAAVGLEADLADL